MEWSLVSSAFCNGAVVTTSQNHVTLPHTEYPALGYKLHHGGLLIIKQRVGPSTSRSLTHTYTLNSSTPHQQRAYQADHTHEYHFLLATSQQTLLPFLPLNALKETIISPDALLNVQLSRVSSLKRATTHQDIPGGSSLLTVCLLADLSVPAPKGLNYSSVPRAGISGRFLALEQSVRFCKFLISAQSPHFFRRQVITRRSHALIGAVPKTLAECDFARVGA